MPMTDFYETKALTDDQFEMRSRVLLVDDQLIVAEAFRRMVADLDDMEVFYCSDPARAVEEATRIQPTIILQDLVMPGMSGLMLLSLLRSHPQTRSVPIVVLSTKEDPKVKSEAFAIGANDYLVKFPDKIELVARIRAHTRGYLVQQQRDEAYKALRRLKIELERKNSELEALSCRDGLTGVLNRRGFDDFLGKEWLRAMRERKQLGLLLIDIDHFKEYNDNYGHQRGDECLRRVAFALGASLKRPTDVVARYGGEEFAVILPDTGIDGGAMIADSLCGAVELIHVPHAFSKTTDHVTVSIGVATLLPAAGDSPEDLIDLADKALYEAKSSGRNQYRCSEPIRETVASGD